MLRLSPCIEMFWHDLEFPQRIARAAALGFDVCEFWGWWEKDVAAIERAVKDHGMTIAACCVKTAFSGDTTSMLLPEGTGPFVEAVKDCLRVGPRVNCNRFIVTTGNEIEGVSRAAQHAACVEALKAAAPIAEDAGATLVLEPLNLLVDHAGYYLSTSAEGFAMVDEVGSPAVKLLFDIYHQQITEGNLTPNICDHIDKIGHFHVANHPGRHEPAVGEINYAHVFARIDATDYDAYIGLEFAPSDPAKTDQILQDVQDMAAAI